MCCATGMGEQGVWWFLEHYKTISFLLTSRMYCPVSILGSGLRKTYAALLFRVLRFTTLAQTWLVLEYVTSTSVLRLATLQWSLYVGLGQTCKLLCSVLVQDLLECFFQSFFSSLTELLCLSNTASYWNSSVQIMLFSSSFKVTPDLLFFKIMHDR